MTGIEFSILVETFTWLEGGDTERFFTSLGAAVALAESDRGEVLLIDVCGFADLLAEVSRRFPNVRRVEAIGLGYDHAKMKAARESRGQYVLYLDGDCLPLPGWKDAFLAKLRAGAPAVGGLTRYDGGYRAKLESIMDFGFLHPARERVLECYAFNNSGFNRDAMLATPAGSPYLRCACYQHAQELKRKGQPVIMVPQARVLHEQQPLIRERTRQGFDKVAAAWADPHVREAGWLRGRVLVVFLFYAMDLLLDWRRLAQARKALELSWLAWLSMFPLFPFFRLLDLWGMLRALIGGPVQGGWSGSLATERTSK